ncbi:IQ calmodulin-binding domain-containing family protein [Colletotrichum plurivorum]|uniref:IQ calmodulin-binding domain-containing family protein n=1 Tax=Colletotrichum plurivorum TaxID=2175906 RepID=A0A8H6KIN2_9PEZI|nr:IQ calmodulin-binding domain-containing family protein [Colletotrichum plurivorum]
MRRPSADLSDPSRNLEESVGSPSSDFDAADVDLSMPPNSDEEIDDGDNRIFTPPPHIAARFYRPSHARRKDSAASSRRNSISSAHSRCSSTQTFTRHGHGAPQSKHVAQHLRRTSFLEDRKARLADRAAHAEKVRLRAAMAKATHRDTTISEERAIAAQQARERNLAEIVASCAEEVKRAKAVAETMKERRERELVKLRVQMEERLAEAERRREELKNRNATKRARGQSLMTRKPAETIPQVTEKDTPALSEAAAATRLQWWWRSIIRKKAVGEFSELGLTIDGVRDTSFDKVTTLLGQDKVVVRTARILRICGLQEGDSGSVAEMAAVRTFLSAFLILGHPTQVLSSKDSMVEAGILQSQPMPRDDLANPQLQDLVTKARDLLISFETIMSRLTAANNYTPPPSLRSALPENYATFYNAFLAWKSRDSDSLVQVMLMQFVELDMILQTVQETTDVAAAEQYRESIKSNQIQLIVRIKKLAGQERGKKMIADAVRKARKARAAKKPTADMKPRAAESEPGETSANAESLVSPNSQTLTPPATPAKGHVKPQPIEIKAGGFIGLLPDNRIVVHELAINREYRIPASEFREHRTLMQVPLFASMRASLEEDDMEASFGCFIIMMRYFKENLQKLVKPGAFMHTTIGDILDVEVAERQFQMGSFSYERFFTSMASLMPKLCAPFRDEEAKDLVNNKLQQGSLVDRVEALTEFVDLMLCDYLNYVFSTAAPQLIESAPEYEKKRFADALEESGSPELTAAEVAWQSARLKVMAEIRKRDPEGINHPRSRPTDEKFYAQMLVDCFTQPAPISPNTVPEMLRLDFKRMTRLSLASQRIVTTGAILLQCKNLLKRDVRTPWKTEATRIMTVLETDHDNVDSTVQGVMAALEAGRSMPAATKTHLKALVTKVLKASGDSIKKGVEPTEPVLRLLLARLRGHLNTRLTANSAKEKVNAATTAQEKLAGLGLAEFAVQVREMLDEISKVGMVDKAAHGMWWNEVAAKVAAESEAAGGSSS